LLTDADAAEAARRDVPVVAHIHTACMDPAYERIHRHNLVLLEEHGVRLAIGSDSYRGTAVLEAICLQHLGLFTSAEVLRIASVTTPQVIFPDRRIGRLADGYEASFLVIDGDPVAQPLFAAAGDDLAAIVAQVTSRIRRRVKQGHVFESDPSDER
jgi:imidazolonepropionase-like amidohydrolase